MQLFWVVFHLLWASTTDAIYLPWIPRWNSVSSDTELHVIAIPTLLNTYPCQAVYPIHNAQNNHNVFTLSRKSLTPLSSLVISETTQMAAKLSEMPDHLVLRAMWAACFFLILAKYTRPATSTWCCKYIKCSGYIILSMETPDLDLVTNPLILCEDKDCSPVRVAECRIRIELQVNAAAVEWVVPVGL